MDLKELLGEELFQQVSEKLGDKKIDIVNDGNWIPKDKFNSTNEQLKELKKQLDERDEQLKELKAKAAGNEELTSKIAELEKLNDQTKQEYETKIAAIKKDTAIELALKDQQAKNIKAVKALLDLDKVSVDGDNLIGLKEQLESLKESDSYLFGKDTLKGRDPNPSNPVDPEYKNNPWKKETFNLTEQGRILKENPELAQKLMQAK
ncbi:phage scaffolding protein [Anaerophilus nitritogenes]|uniref:phage scaffolding protein n=1 Tax=Anaerophilus nitritogenes TaxID=2498136 RepID=UPI00101C53D9|nr:phage scaffolding protein [Anaerophilus nitritogenes]